MNPQIIFWVFSILLFVLALAFLLPPLLRKPTDIVDDRRDQNIRITRQQLAELEAEFKAGGLDQDSYEAARQELEDTLYNDLDNAESVQTAASSQSWSRVPALMVSLLVPVLAIGVYLKYGKAEAIPESSVVVSQAAAGKPKLSLEQMLTKLEKKLQDNPDNFTGWVMLGRSYMVMNRPGDAVEAYRKAVALNDKEASVLLQLADAIGTHKAGRLTGEPEELVQKALKLQPDNVMGLWLAGMAARQRGANEEAVSYWKKVLPMLDANAEERKEVIALIQQAGGSVEGLAAAPGKPAAATGNAEKADTGNKTAAAGGGITVSIDLADELKARSQPGQTVFIYAKAVSGPPMPLAAVRKQVKDLPLTVTLDDSMAMMPQLKLSGFGEVTVGARISVSGTPTKSPGDLYTEQSPVKQGSSIELTIDKVVQ